MKIQIGIIGPEEKNLKKNKEKILEIAENMGKNLAKKGAVLITGGCSGVAESASRGANKKKGITIGTPGRKRKSSRGVKIEICTPVEIGDYLFAGIPSCDSIIAIPGDAGTVAELAIAYRYKKPLVFVKGFGEEILKELFGSYDPDYPLAVARTPEKAVEIALELGKKELEKLK